jgi:hypothetical protein
MQRLVQFKPFGAILVQEPRRKVKEPGKNPMPGLKSTFPN